MPAESAAEAESPLKSPVSTVEKGKKSRECLFTVPMRCCLLVLGWALPACLKLAVFYFFIFLFSFFTKIYF